MSLAVAQPTVWSGRGQMLAVSEGSQELNAISSPTCPIVGTAASTQTDIPGKNVLAPDLPETQVEA